MATKTAQRKRNSGNAELKGIREVNGRYKIEVMVQGQRKSGTAETLAEAIILRENLINTLNQRHEDAPREAAPAWTLNQAIELTFNLHWQGTADENKQRIRCRHLLGFFAGDAPLASITAERVVAFRAWAEKTLGNGQNTINKKVMALSKILRTSYNMGKLERLPKLHIARIKNHRIRFMTPEEEATTLNNFILLTTPDHVDAFKVLIDTGFRLGELWKLECDNVNFTTNTITLWDGTTKNGLARTVPMTGRVREVLQRRCAEHQAGPLWPGRNNNWFQHQWGKVRSAMCKDDDPDWVTHMLRHTCCSRLVQAGVNLFLVQQWMGHKSLQITQRYAHHAPEHLKSAGNALEQFTKQLNNVA